MLDKVIDRALLLLQPDLEKAELLKLLQQEENLEKIKAAQEAPIPGKSQQGSSLPKDDDTVTDPHVLAGWNMREVMLLGALATIWGLNKRLETICINSFKANIPERGAYINIETDRDLYYKMFGEMQEGKPCVIMQSGL